MTVCVHHGVCMAMFTFIPRRTYLSLVTKSLILCIIGVCGFGQGQSRATSANVNSPKATELAFEVVSIRQSKPGGPEQVSFGIEPDGYRATNQSLWSTIMLAYFPMPKWSNDRIKGLPSWVSEQYDITAKIAPKDIVAWQNQGPDRELLQAALRSLLADRCKLTMRNIPTQVSSYDLVFHQRGTQLKESKPNEVSPKGAVALATGGLLVPMQKGSNQLAFVETPMKSFAAYLSMSVRSTVQDKTGLTGTYDFVLHRYDDPISRDNSSPSTPDPGPDNPWDLAALGFKLTPSKTTTDTLVVAHIEKPSAN